MIDFRFVFPAFPRYHWRGERDYDRPTSLLKIPSHISMNEFDNIENVNFTHTRLHFSTSASFSKKWRVYRVSAVYLQKFIRLCLLGRNFSTFSSTLFSLFPCWQKGICRSLICLAKTFAEERRKRNKDLRTQRTHTHAHTHSYIEDGNFKWEGEILVQLEILKCWVTIDDGDDDNRATTGKSTSVNMLHNLH